MTLTLPDGSTLTVKFHRYRTSRPRPTTVAEIIYPSNSRVVSESAPRGSDVFNKATGRRMALRNALSYAKFPRATRTAVWREYFRVHADLRRNKVKGATA